MTQAPPIMLTSCLSSPWQPAAALRWTQSGTCEESLYKSAILAQLAGSDVRGTSAAILVLERHFLTSVEPGRSGSSSGSRWPFPSWKDAGEPSWKQSMLLL